MTLHFNNGNSLLPTSGGEAMMALKNVLKAAGWTVVSSNSGNGVDTWGSGDNIGSTKAIIEHPGAWFVMQQPSGGAAPFSGSRQILFHHSSPAGWPSVSTHNVWRIAYSYGGHFTSPAANPSWVPGSPGYLVPPVASDQVHIWGGGPDGSNTGAAPVFGNQNYGYTSLFPADGGYRVAIAADDAAPFSWFMVAFPGPSGRVPTIIFFDGMEVGSYNPLDVDPYVMWASYTSDETILAANGWFVGSNPAASIPKTFIKKGLSGEVWGYVLGDTEQFFVNYMGANIYTGKDDFRPISYVVPNGWGLPKHKKGTSTLFRWPSVSRNNGVLYTITDAITGNPPANNTHQTGNFIRLNDVVAPWDDTAPLA